MFFSFETFFTAFGLSFEVKKNSLLESKIFLFLKNIVIQKERQHSPFLKIRDLADRCRLVNKRSQKLTSQFIWGPHVIIKNEFIIKIEQQIIFHAIVDLVFKLLKHF